MSNHKEREMGDHQDPFESKVSRGAMACAQAIFNGISNQESLDHYDIRTIAEMIQAQIDAAQPSPVAPPAESEVEREIREWHGYWERRRVEHDLDGSNPRFAFARAHKDRGILLALLDAVRQSNEMLRQARAEAERELERSREYGTEYVTSTDELIDRMIAENDALRERCAEMERERDEAAERYERIGAVRAMDAAIRAWKNKGSIERDYTVDEVVEVLSSYKRAKLVSEIGYDPAPPPPTWTRERPTEAGLYWMRRGTERPALMKVYDGNPDELWGTTVVPSREIPWGERSVMESTLDGVEWAECEPPLPGAEGGA